MIVAQRNGQLWVKHTITFFENKTTFKILSLANDSTTSDSSQQDLLKGVLIANLLTLELFGELCLDNNLQAHLHSAFKQSAHLFAGTTRSGETISNLALI